METVKINEIKADVLEVKYQGQKVTIDITKELAINESTLNSSLRDFPSNYAFLCGLRDKAIKTRDRLEQEKDQKFSELWVFYKNSDTRMTNDTANHRTINSKKYQDAEKAFLKASYEASRLISICRAYESRERILQTLSANLRKEKQ